MCSPRSSANEACQASRREEEPCGTCPAGLLELFVLRDTTSQRMPQWGTMRLAGKSWLQTHGYLEADRNSREVYPVAVRRNPSKH